MQKIRGIILKQQCETEKYTFVIHLKFYVATGIVPKVTNFYYDKRKEQWHF